MAVVGGWIFVAGGSAAGGSTVTVGGAAAITVPQAELATAATVGGIIFQSE